MVKVLDDLDDPIVISTLLRGGVVVARTDTLYGILACANNQSAVERVYKIKSRDEKKSPVVLISDIGQMWDPVSSGLESAVDVSWPDRTTYILPSQNAPYWIKRDNQSVAYRLPNVNSLRQIIDNTGPLIAPSANPEGEAPSTDIDMAVRYFGDDIDLYIDGGVVSGGAPSKLIKFNDDGSTVRLR